jgi:hypothetical protein
MDLVDLDRPQLDEALVRVEAALVDPEAARRRSDRTPVFLRVLGPTMSIRALDAEGRGVPRFALRVQWEKEPGHFQTWGGYGEDGVATARVPRVPSTVEVWGAQDADGRSLPSGPASAEAVAGATSVEVRLPKGLALAGRLVDGDGKPLGGIRVVAFPSDAGTLGVPAAKLPPGGLGVGVHGFEAHGADTSGADGRFTLQGLAASRYRVTVAAEGEWYTVNDVEADAGSGPIEVIVERGMAPDHGAGPRWEARLRGRRRSLSSRGRALLRGLSKRPGCHDRRASAWHTSAGLRAKGATDCRSFPPTSARTRPDCDRTLDTAAMTVRLPARK